MYDVFQLVGTCLEGKYEITAVVAEGGFGVVYQAMHQTLDKVVAVKVLKVPESLQGTVRTSFLESFACEARTIARLEHPAIVRVIDFGATRMPTGAAAPWMVLEWLKGAPLESDLEERRGRGGRTPMECMALLRPVFEALSVAHEEGVAHRDIKPANLMVTAHGAPGRSTGRRRGETALKVMDFGIAKVMSPEETSASGLTRTRASLVAFSLPYAAPEQVSGTRTGPWTDVHALALILSEMLTDTAPYPGTEVMEIHLQVVSQTRPTPAHFGLDVGAWEPILARALALRPGERYATAGEFLTALEAGLDGARHRRVGETRPLSRPPERLFTTLQPAERPALAPRPARLHWGGVLVALAALGGIAGGAIALVARTSSTPDATGVPAAAARALPVTAQPPLAPAPAAPPVAPLAQPVAAPPVVAPPVVAPPLAAPAAPVVAGRVRPHRAARAWRDAPTPALTAPTAAPATPVGRIPAE
jgi:serine/threonine protein kinase